MNVGGVTLGGTDALGRSSLVIETADVAEPVPEPTTIFGSAIALGLGGWLKRKKSNPQHKTTPMRLIYRLTRV
ncbi:PEP-CTERM sorting domain-containing protein [Microcoleus sp. D3_18a_C4]|uniref:PEP-CTERM sorting domain-containing protein n=1 Tax=Microcoleus sp. D3_18a_C4 TaxID=3055332 RepID=UPI002FD277CB